MLTMGYAGREMEWAHVRRLWCPLRYARRLLKVWGYVLQRYFVFLPNGLKNVDDFGKSRAGSRFRLPTLSNDLGELFRPRVIVLNLRSSVLL